MVYKTIGQLGMTITSSVARNPLLYVTDLPSLIGAYALHVWGPAVTGIALGTN